MEQIDNKNKDLPNDEEEEDQYPIDDEDKIKANHDNLKIDDNDKMKYAYQKSQQNEETKSRYKVFFLV